jgi:histone acetyltransferase (RNA polymerase elongator complex component)
MRQTQVVVRPAAEADAAAISALLNELGYSLDVTQVRNNITLLSVSSSDAIFVAEAASTVVGVLSFHIMPLFHVVGNLGRISSLVIGSQWQRHGVGRKLIEVAEEFGWSHGCQRIEVTSGDHRTGAHEFYQKLGYQIDERRFIKRPAAG